MINQPCNCAKIRTAIEDLADKTGNETVKRVTRSAMSHLDNRFPVQGRGKPAIKISKK